ncbi:MAG TPA: glutaredoxin family protein [Burkholderiaceae bacterium]|nr:glutaredoxin family protein [Burkholderiaceae bacterium]
MIPERLCASRLARLCGAALVAMAAAAPAAAQTQYKVVGPDGKVTYTDRVPATNATKVTSLNSRGGPSAAVDVALPLELRQPAARYPVTLYTVSGACNPCEAARVLLRTRGVPYAEKQVLSAEDGEALEKLAGSRDVPVLSIGTQVMRGLAPEVWGSYLDAAGYPRESRLPASYQYAAATPVVERREAVTPKAPPAAPAAPAADSGAPVPANPTGIKF